MTFAYSRAHGLRRLLMAGLLLTGASGIAGAARAQMDTPCTLPGSEDSAVEALCPVHEGLARVKIAGLWGFLDGNGAVVVPPRYARLGELVDGRARARVDAGWGYIDRQGEWVVAPTLDGAGDFSNGRASAKLDGRWGQIDRNGQWVIRPQYGAIGPYNGRSAVARGEDGRSLMLDGRGEVLQTFAPDLSVGFRPNALGLYPVDRLGEQLLIDSRGRQHPMPREVASRELGDGLIIARPFEADGRTPGPRRGAVDVQGRWRVPARFDVLEDFHDGLAIAQAADGEGAGRGLVDTRGRFQVDPRYTRLDYDPRGWYVGRTGTRTEVLDRRGRVRVSMDCDQVAPVKVRGLVDSPWAVLAGCGQSWVLREGLRKPVRSAIADPEAQASADHLLLSAGGDTAQSADGPAPVAVQLFNARGRVVLESDGRLLGGPDGPIDEVVLVARSPETPTRGARALPLAMVFGDGRMGLITPRYTVVSDPDWRADTTWRSYSYASRGDVLEGPLPVETRDGWGAVDAEGKWVVEPRFDRLDRFRYGVAEAVDARRMPWIVDADGHALESPDDARRLIAVSEGVMLGLDRHGGLSRLTMPEGRWERLPLPDGVKLRPDDFHAGLASARQGDRYGLIDTHGRWRLAPRFDRALIPHQDADRQPVGWKSMVEYQDQDSTGQLYGWVDVAGEEVVPPRYRELSLRKQDRALAVIGPHNGVISLQGDTLVAPHYNDVRPLGEGWYAARRPPHNGLVDASGRWVAEPFDVSFSAADTRYQVRYRQGQAQLIDLRGRVSTQAHPLDIPDEPSSSWWPVQYRRDQDDAYTVFRGFDFKPRVSVPGKVDRYRRFAEGVVAFEPRERTARAHVGLVDAEGHVLGLYPFDLIEPMHEGLAAFQQSEAVPDSDRQFRFGYLDRQGAIAIPARFTGATAFSEGRAVVIHRHNLGLIDRQGRLQVQGAWRCGEHPVLIDGQDRIVWPADAPQGCGKGGGDD